MQDPTPSSRRLAGLVLALAGIAPLSAHACSADAFLGDICAVAMDFCPQNYVVADGRLLKISDYSALYTLLWTEYGGDGNVTFALPDLRGRIPVGAGEGTGLQAVGLGQAVGQQMLVLDESQAPMPGHTHTATFTPTSGNVTVTLPATAGKLGIDVSLPVAVATGTASAPSTQAAHLAGIGGKVGGSPVAFEGPYTTVKPAAPYKSHLEADVVIEGAPSTPAATMQLDMVDGGTVGVKPAPAAIGAPVPTQSPALALTICIAFQGAFPIRN